MKIILRKKVGSFEEHIINGYADVSKFIQEYAFLIGIQTKKILLIYGDLPLVSTSSFIAQKVNENAIIDLIIFV